MLWKPGNLPDTEKQSEHRLFPRESLNIAAEIWDVVVVVAVAGLSGLSAAHLLRKRNTGLKILILEGKGEIFWIQLTKHMKDLAKPVSGLTDRVGGCTVSKEIPTAGGTDWWDFGGQWTGR